MDFERTRRDMGSFLEDNAYIGLCVGMNLLFECTK